MNETKINRERPCAWWGDNGDLNIAFKVPDDERWKTIYNNTELREFFEKPRNDDNREIRLDLYFKLISNKSKEEADAINKELEALFIELNRQLDEVLKSV